MPEGQPYGANIDGYYMCGLENRSVAYVGSSSISHVLIRNLTLRLRDSGAYPLLWIKEPDPRRPANVDILLIDGFWIMNHMDLAPQYVANFLSLKEPTLWYWGHPPWARKHLDEPWELDRVVVILPGFRPKQLARAINSSALVPNIAKPLTEHDIWYFPEEPEWSLIRIYRPSPWMPYFRYYNNGTLYRIGYVEPSWMARDEHGNVVDESASLDNPLAWEHFATTALSLAIRGLQGGP